MAQTEFSHNLTNPCRLAGCYQTFPGAARSGRLLRGALAAALHIQGMCRQQAGAHMFGGTSLCRPIRCCTHQPTKAAQHCPADLEAGQRARAPSKDVVWGPLVFEARRFVELRKKSFWDQFMSAESFGMGVFYTANVRGGALLLAGSESAGPGHLQVSCHQCSSLTAVSGSVW